MHRGMGDIVSANRNEIETEILVVQKTQLRCKIFSVYMMFQHDVLLVCVL